jgi:Mg/Co/Ni transporter MgtE
MIEATLANLRKSSDFFKQEEIIHILDGRKKEEIGFFVPNSFKDEFIDFITKIEKKKRQSLLKRVAKAQKNDPISEGSVDDGL